MIHSNEAAATTTAAAPEVAPAPAASKAVKGLAKMREEFPRHQISLLPKPYKKDSERGLCSVCGTYHGLPALHLDYVGHAAITLRLLEADPQWDWQPMAFTPDGLPQFDSIGGLWIKLTVAGVSRIGYGNAESKPTQEKGAREKEVIGDALRNASMRFGAALELWHKGDLYGPDGTGDVVDDDGVITPRPADGNPNGAAPPAAQAPPARRSAAAAPARKPATAAQTTTKPSPAPAAATAVGVSEGQLNNLLAKIKSLQMTDAMKVAMLTKVGVRAIDQEMTLSDWKKVKAELDAAARLV